MHRSVCGWVVALAAIAAANGRVWSQTEPVRLIDDRAITLLSPGDLAAKRRALIRHIWGTDGFPAGRWPSWVLTNVPSPASRLTDLARVDELRMDLAPGLQGLAYHFIAERPNGALVIVHQGHACTLDDDPGPTDVGYGLRRTIQALLREGYGVLGVFMPHLRPGDCTGGHAALFETNMVGSPLRLFLESTAIGLNHVKRPSATHPTPVYRDYHMIGLSGGGWTTTIYAAIDPTVRCSFPVAGTIPLYLRSGGSIGDREQYEPSFYRLAGYPDLYLLGATGPGRAQVQILVRRDDCCFGEAQHDARAAGLSYLEAMRAYEGRVQAALQILAPGSFRLEIDETAPSHMISHHAINDIILPELRKTQARAAPPTATPSR